MRLTAGILHRAQRCLFPLVCGLLLVPTASAGMTLARWNDSATADFAVYNILHAPAQTLSPSEITGILIPLMFDPNYPDGCVLETEPYKQPFIGFNSTATFFLVNWYRANAYGCVSYTEVATKISTYGPVMDKYALPPTGAMIVQSSYYSNSNENHIAGGPQSENYIDLRYGSAQQFTGFRLMYMSNQDANAVSQFMWESPAKIVLWNDPSPWDAVLDGVAYNTVSFTISACSALLVLYGMRNVATVAWRHNFRMEMRTYIYLISITSAAAMAVSKCFFITSTALIFLNPLATYSSYLAFSLLVILFSGVLSQSRGAGPNRAIRIASIAISTFALVIPASPIALALSASQSLQRGVHVISIMLPFFWLIATSAFAVYGYRFYNRSFHQSLSRKATRAALRRLTRMCSIGAFSFLAISILNIVCVSQPQTGMDPVASVTALLIADTIILIRPAALILLLRIGPTPPSTSGPSSTTLPSTPHLKSLSQRLFGKRWSSTSFARSSRDSTGSECAKSPRGEDNGEKWGSGGHLLPSFPSPSSSLSPVSSTCHPSLSSLAATIVVRCASEQRYMHMEDIESAYDVDDSDYSTGYLPSKAPPHPSPTIR